MSMKLQVNACLCRLSFTLGCIVCIPRCASSGGGRVEFDLLFSVYFLLAAANVTEAFGLFFSLNTRGLLFSYPYMVLH